MKIRTIQTGLLTTLIGWFLMPLPVQALNISDTPLFLIGSVKPLVMLDISKDQQLYKKAYNDYSDLDSDGQIETTYKHSINYYGYFDPGKCYTYDSTDKRFEPASVSATKKCSGQWSGNFLNWASMARMDAVRKLLYGGLRSPDRSNGDGSGISDGDTATSTVLERVFLPNDAHSWAKYYDGDGGATISEVTPYTPPTTTTTSSTSNTITNTGSNTVSYVFTLGSATGFANNDYVLISADANNYLKGQITAVSSSDITVSVANANYAGSGTYSSWTVENLSKRGITLCNTTLGASSGIQRDSQTNTNLPRLRVAGGNFSLWSANERWQCRWIGEKSESNSNIYADSGIPAASGNPTLGTHGTGTGLGDYFVRVQACVSGLIGSEKCKEYTSGNFKPIGLLQVYGDPDQIHFGLMTGSYDNNISGGVLRKNTTTFTNEVNANGTFTTTVGIVKTLDRMRIYGYDFNDGTYLDSSGDNCDFGLTTITEGNCTSWGNPMSELYYESLRYFAGAGSPTTAYSSASTKDTALGLPRPSWAQPLDASNYCAPLNSLVFNASVSTNDFDLAAVSMAGINSASTAAALADLVGTNEVPTIAGGSYFIGSSATSGADNNELCNAKTVVNLGSIKGICPEGPTLLGSYLMPGLAYHARTNKIRTGTAPDIELNVPAGDTKSLKVATYGIQLATNVPRIPITLPGKTVILQPIFRLDRSGFGGGALVDLKILSQTATANTATGKIYLNWEDSEQGGDYDQDEWGILSYCMTTVDGGCGLLSSANTIKITTDVIAKSTPYEAGFGYVVSGTTQDGPHFHSGINGFDFTDPISGVLGCSNCNHGDAATSVTYTLGTGTAKSLEDPLFYAAKWGGFNDLPEDIDGDGILDAGEDLNSNGILDAADGKPGPAKEWDVLTTSGTPGSDGIPDNYFLVSNPLGLETALNSAFLKILKDSSASAVATNSSTLNTTSRVFQGRFSSSFWSGQLLSYRLSPTTGAVLSAATAPPNWVLTDIPYPEWDAGQKIKAQADTASDSRTILTRSSTTGTSVDFTYANLNSTQQASLNLNVALQQDNCGPERVDFLRGRSAREGTGSLACATAPATATPAITQQRFRTRSISILGDIINSNPSFVGQPSAGYSDVDHPGYSAFRTSFKNRAPVVYVGANDGMLHGFDVSTTWVDTDPLVDSDSDGTLTNDKDVTVPAANAGNEVLAYVPSPVYPNLRLLTDDNYKSLHKFFVDSSPMMADVCVSACTSAVSAVWKTVLIGGLGAGGKGFYALNVTNPLDATKDAANTPLFNLTTGSHTANILMWEFTNADDVDLGFTFNTSPTKLSNGQAKQIVKFENGRWGVVVGNGYNSTPSTDPGKAALYVLFVEGPTGGTTPKTWQAGGVDYVKIVAENGPNNGLSTPVPFDADGDGLVDTVYAGDLKGNVWKFDLSSATASSWAVAYSGTALFSAGTSQPITTPPEVSLHPTSGLMVLIGTGKFLGSPDDTNSAFFTTQSFYGLHDNGSVVSSISNLIEQTITTTTVSSKTFRTTSATCDNLPLDATLPDCPSPAKGWYTELPTSGERVTGSPKLDNGLIIFNTFIPSVSPCDFGGTGWLMALNYLTGTTPAYKVFNTNSDDKIDSADTAVAGLLVGAALGGSTLIKSAPGGDASVAVSSLTTGKTASDLFSFGAGSVGRINWREILQ